MNRICAFRFFPMTSFQNAFLNRGCGLISLCLLLLAAGVVISNAAEEKLKTVPELIKDLGAEDKFVRRKAAELLGEIGPPARSAVPALIGALEDRDQQVWFNSAMALARIGPGAEEAIPALVKWLDGSKGQGERRAYRRQVWYRTAYALGRIGPAAIPELVKALDDDKAFARSGAAKALGFIGPKAVEAAPRLAAKLGDSDSEVRLQIAEALGQIGPVAIPLIIPALSAPETLARTAATFALGSLGPAAQDAAQPLADLYHRETDLDVRANVIEALIKIRYDAGKFVPLLLCALKADSHAVRHAAANGLLLTPAPDRNVVPPLLELLERGDSFTKEQAAYVLGRIGPAAKAAAPLLVQAIDALGEEPPVFPFSDALVQIGSPAVPALIRAVGSRRIEKIGREHWTMRCLKAIGETAVPELTKAFGDSNASIRFAAIEILKGQKSAAKAIENPLLNLARDPVPEVRASALLALSEIDIRTESYLPKLTEALRDESAQVRASATLALANAGPDAKPAVEPLIQALRDADTSVRKGAIKALGAIGSGAEAAVPELATALKTGDKALRIELIHALGKIGTTAAAAVPQLIEFVDDDSSDLRAALFAALGSIGPGAKPVVPALLKAVKDVNPETRAHAVAALAKIEADAKAVMPILDEALADQSAAVRKVAAEAAGKLGEAAQDAVPKLFALLKAEEDRAVALDSLRQIKVKSTPLLVEALSINDPSVRLFACESLGRLGPLAKDAIPALKKALNDDYDIVRRQARMALRRIEEEGEKKPSP